MNSSNHFISCWLVLIIMLISSAPMTLLSLDPSSDLIELMADGMGEEEAEDSETEEEAKKREFDESEIEIVVNPNGIARGNLFLTVSHYSVFREVFSPPPEV